MHDVHDPGHIFVGFRHLLVHRGAGRRTDHDAPCLELLRNIAGPGELFGLVSGEAPSRAVTAGSKRLPERSGRPDEHVGVPPHVARDQHRLADVPELRRELGVPRGEGAGRALAVDAQPP